MHAHPRLTCLPQAAYNRGWGPTTKAERWNGRHAMFGWIALLATGYAKGHGLIPNGDVPLDLKVAPPCIFFRRLTSTGVGHSSIPLRRLALQRESHHHGGPPAPPLPLRLRSCCSPILPRQALPRGRRGARASSWTHPESLPWSYAFGVKYSILSELITNVI